LLLRLWFLLSVLELLLSLASEVACLLLRAESSAWVVASCCVSVRLMAAKFATAVLSDSVAFAKSHGSYHGRQTLRDSNRATNG
jgi:hypothetical protein